MTVQYKYIADDGREFDNREDCIYWEHKCHNGPLTWHFFDEDCAPLSVEDYALAQCALRAMVEDASFLKIDEREEAYRDIGFMWREFNIGDPQWTPGLYMRSGMHFIKVNYEQWLFYGGRILKEYLE